MITIELPWPDKRLSPNSRCHWRAKAEAAALARVTARYATENDGWMNHSVDYLAQYKFYPPDRRHRDIDNCLSMCKPYQDGVCESLEFDDSCIKRTVLEWGEVVKGGKVVLRLEEME